MSVKLWGPGLWNVIHITAKNYPNNPSITDKKIAYQLTKYLAFIIPCQKCQLHYMKNFTKFPPTVDSQAQFFKWTVRMHNQVNRKNNKKCLNINQALQHTPANLNQKKIHQLFDYLKNQSYNHLIDSNSLNHFIRCVHYFARQHYYQTLNR